MPAVTFRLEVPGELRTSTAAHDVTGGIGAKLEAAVRVAALGVPVHIVEVATEHAAAAIGLEPGAPARGTVISLADGEEPAEV